jgi:hypothetical protein
MTVDPAKIFSKRIRVKSLILFALLLVYIGLSFVAFFKFVGPSLSGHRDQKFAADSTTYIGAADALREGREDIFLTVALSSFPNTVLSPILLSWLFKSTFGMVLANYAMFFLAIVLLKRSFSFSTGIFLGLMLLNATTTISLLAVNKEILDLLAVSIFFFGYVKHRNSVIAIAMLLALFNRWEICLVMLTFLLAQSKLNPWRHKRALTLVILVVLLTVLIPLFGSEILGARINEVAEAHTVAWFDSLEMHYMFGLIVIPKILFTLFATLIAHPFSADTYFNYTDVANSTILYSNNLATVIVFAVLAWRHRFTLRSNLVYFAMVGFIIMAISPATVQRYVYFAYVLLCLQAARIEDNTAPQISAPQKGVESLDPSLTDSTGAAFG